MLSVGVVIAQQIQVKTTVDETIFPKDGQTYAVYDGCPCHQGMKTASAGMEIICPVILQGIRYINSLGEG